MNQIQAEKLVLQDTQGNVLDIEDAHRAGLITPELRERLELYRDIFSRILQDAKELA